MKLLFIIHTLKMAFLTVPCKSVIALAAEHTISDNRQYKQKN